MSDTEVLLKQITKISVEKGNVHGTAKGSNY